MGTRISQNAIVPFKNGIPVMKFCKYEMSFGISYLLSTLGLRAADPPSFFVPLSTDTHTHCNKDNGNEWNEMLSK
jgi:hypothetical protein